MKHLLMFLFILSNNTFAQSDFPDFLKGTWKIENKDNYEHWDKLNDNTLKGFSYKLNNGQLSISEYLEISRTRKDIVLTACVLNQNNGKGVQFKLSRKDSTFTFENPKHDFPKKIIYNKLNNIEVFVEVFDENNNGFSYKMNKSIEKVLEKDTSTANPNYDLALAQKLEADDYGMKSYILVILKTGTNPTSDQNLINTSFRGHMKNINQLVKEGKLIVAGPISKNEKTYRGIFILNVNTIEEAETLLQSDPAIKEKILDIELYQWYGSAALNKYLEYSDKVWKVKP